MKLYDLIESEIPVKKQDFSSLIKNLSKIKFDELNQILHLFDNVDILKHTYLKWHPIHYAAMNKDFRVLKTFLQLHHKHHISTDVFTTSSKEGIPECATVLDISFYNKSVPHAVIAKEYGVKSKIWQNNMLNVIFQGMNQDYLVRQSNTQEIFEKLTQELISVDKTFVYPDNLLTPFLFTKRNFIQELDFIDKREFDEKEQILSEFKINLQTLFTFTIHYAPEYFDFISKRIITTGEELARSKEHQHLLENYLDIFTLPFFQKIEFLSLRPESIDYNYSNWENVYYYEKDNQNRINFVDILLANHSFEIAQLLSQAKEKLANINNGFSHHAKEIRSISDVLEKTFPVIMAHQLNENLSHKTTIQKTRKI